MKKTGLWLAAVPLALGLVGCGQSSAGTVSKSSASSSSAAESSSLASVKETQPGYAKGFKRVTVPIGMEGTWYGYAANTDELTTMKLAPNAVTITGPGADGKRRLLYDASTRTQEDQTALSASNGGSASGPQLTAGDKYREANWAAAQVTKIKHADVLNLWNHWYISDAGTQLRRASRPAGKKSQVVLVAPQTGEIYYQTKPYFAGDKLLPTGDDVFLLASLEAMHLSVDDEYLTAVEDGMDVNIDAFGKSILGLDDTQEEGQLEARLINITPTKVTVAIDHIGYAKDTPKGKPQTFEIKDLAKKKLTASDSLDKLIQTRMRVVQNWYTFADASK